MSIGDKVSGTKWGTVTIVGSEVKRNCTKKWQIKLPDGTRKWVEDDELFN